LGCLGLEETKINDGLITEILEKLKWTSEVVVGSLGPIAASEGNASTS
jgi:hypothetical protein